MPSILYTKHCFVLRTKGHCCCSWCLVQLLILKALLEVASGLDYLHAMGVVHGDLKTANVLLKAGPGGRDGPRARGAFVCKLADFGLSRVMDLDATHISTK
jgi:serine/threonine protein kinase